MKRITLLIFLCINLNTMADQPLFTKANTAYASDSIAKAIALYDSILANGRESSELYYNLGNCYYKNKDWANAIWHYEKSLQLNNNEQTKENIELTKLKIIDRIEAQPQLFYKKWWTYLTQILSTQVWQILALLGVGLIFILRLTSQFTSLKSKLITKILAPITVLILLITQTSYHNNFNKKEAIIFSETITVNSEPSSNSTNKFTLHAGSKVEVININGNWINIKIANGNSGWIEYQSIKAL